VVVSHRVDHGRGGALHKETAYGIVARDLAPYSTGKVQTVTRAVLNEQTFKKSEDLDRIRDKHLAETIHEHVKSHGGTMKDALAAYRARTGVQRVRVVDAAKTVVAIPGADGQTRKAYEPGSNYCYDLFEVPGKGGTVRWDGEIISRFDANRADFVPRWRQDHPAWRRVMQLHNDDPVALLLGDDPVVYRVVKQTPGRIYLAPHNEAGALKARDVDKEDPFKYLIASPDRLREHGARLVHVDEIGRVRGLPVRPG